MHCTIGVLVDLLHSYNVYPYATVGHPPGGTASTYAAGRILPEEAIVSVHCRGRSIATNTQDRAKLAVGNRTHEVTDLLEDHKSLTSIAHVKSPSSVTLFGFGDAEARGDIH